MRNIFSGLALLPAILAFAVPVFADPPNSMPDGPASPFSAPLTTVDTLRPVRVTEPPVIDGEFNEPFWKLAPSLTTFKTFLPDFDIVPKEQTEVALAYDAENIYFGFRCYDDPSLIKASVSARDKMMQDDFVCINLDAAGRETGPGPRQGKTGGRAQPHGKIRHHHRPHPRRDDQPRFQPGRV